jgi:hypothetical protein
MAMLYPMIGMRRITKRVAHAVITAGKPTSMRSKSKKYQIDGGSEDMAFVIADVPGSNEVAPENKIGTNSVVTKNKPKNRKNFPIVDFTKKPVTV